MDSSFFSEFFAKKIRKSKSEKEYLILRDVQNNEKNCTSRKLCSLKIDPPFKKWRDPISIHFKQPLPTTTPFNTTLLLPNPLSLLLSMVE